MGDDEARTELCLLIKKAGFDVGDLHTAGNFQLFGNRFINVDKFSSQFRDDFRNGLGKNSFRIAFGVFQTGGCLPFVTSAFIGDDDIVSRPAATELFEQLAIAESWHTVNGSDHVSCLQTRFFRGTVLGYFINEYTIIAVNAFLFGKSGVQLDDPGTQQATLYDTKFTKVLYDLAHNRRRNGKAVAGEHTRRAADGSVDAHQVAVDVDQGATRIPGINDGICLDERLDGQLAAGTADDIDATPLGGDDAGRDRARQTERVAYGHHPLANAEFIAVGKLDRWQIGSVDLDEGDVCRWVNTDNLRLIGLHIVEHYFQVFGAIHYVVIRSDVTVGADDDTGAGALL